MAFLISLLNENIPLLLEGVKVVVAEVDAVATAAAVTALAAVDRTASVAVLVISVVVVWILLIRDPSHVTLPLGVLAYVITSCEDRVECSGSTLGTEMSVTQLSLAASCD